MRQPRQPSLDVRGRALREQVALQQFRQGGHADTDTGLPEKPPPGHTQCSVYRIHSHSFITTSFRLRMRLVTLV